MYSHLLLAATLVLGVSAIPRPHPNPMVTPAPVRRLSLRDSSLPASSGSSALSDVKTVASGETFDGGMYMYDRGVDCTGQEEGGDSDAVFQIENGGTIKNVIIGPNQIEGIHCQGSCTLENVWWSAVCEDAFTIKNQDSDETTYITGGGAFGAEDKVLQHNGGGTLSVSDFTVENFGKLYRSCGNCDSMYERHVIMDGITATSGSELAGINSNYGDSATFTNIVAIDVDDICVTYTGNDDGDEPEENGSGADGTYCIYSSSDISTSASDSSSSDSDESASSTAAVATSTSSSDDSDASQPSAVATATQSAAPESSSYPDGSSDSGDDDSDDDSEDDNTSDDGEDSDDSDDSDDAEDDDDSDSEDDDDSDSDDDDDSDSDDSSDSDNDEDNEGSQQDSSWSVFGWHPFGF